MVTIVERVEWILQEHNKINDITTMIKTNTDTSREGANTTPNLLSPTFTCSLMPSTPRMVR